MASPSSTNGRQKMGRFRRLFTRKKRRGDRTQQPVVEPAGVKANEELLDKASPPMDEASEQTNTAEGQTAVTDTALPRSVDGQVSEFLNQPLAKKRESFSEQKHSKNFDLSPIEEQNGSRRNSTSETAQHPKNPRTPQRVLSATLPSKFAPNYKRNLLYPANASVGGQPRRGSFIFRPASPSGTPLSLSRASSLLAATPDDQSSSAGLDSASEGFVTPFAQVLKKLNDLTSQQRAIITTVESRVKESLDSTESDRAPEALESDELMKKMQDISEDLQWCIDELQKMSAEGTAVGKFATSKFKRLLTSELSSFSGGSIQMQAVARWISSTFVEPDSEVEMARGMTRGKRPRSGSVVQAVQEYKRHVAHSNSLQQLSESGGRKRISSSQLDTVDQEELEKMLEKLDYWEFDIFKVNHLTLKRPLAAVVFTIFQERDFLSILRIPEITLLNYLNKLEAAYLDNPYHNSIHAADVAQTAHRMLLSPVFDGRLTEVEILATIFAAAIHDVAHPGVNNDFLIDSGHELALLYNDKSVLESHHISTGFRLMQKEDCNIFQKLEKKKMRPLRKLVVEMVLATDPHQHLNNLGAFKSWVESKHSRAKSDQILLDDEKDVTMVLQALLHSADISNPCKQLKLSKEWGKRITSELFAQGDKSRERGWPVPSHMDRNVMTIHSLQIGFIKNIAMPQWEAWYEFVSDDETPLKNMDGNLKFWMDFSDEEAEEKDQDSDKVVTAHTSRDEDKHTDTDDTHRDANDDRPAEVAGEDAKVLASALTPRDKKKFFVDD